jgi:uncharacterized protein
MIENHQLQTFLKELAPFLGSECYVFISLPNDFTRQYLTLTSDLISGCLSFFREKEGLSLVVSQQAIEKHLDKVKCISDVQYRCITLNVYSDLESVGLTAAVANCLAEIGISANIVAGYFHDHILVPEEHAEQAFLALTQLSER